MVRVSVHPIDGSIARAFIERLLMFDVVLCLDEKDAQEIQAQHATLLQAGIAEVAVSNESEIRFDFLSQPNTIQVNDSCSIVLHDVLPSGKNSGLVNEALASIWNSIEHSMDGDASHYWVAESDVVDALVRIALHQPQLPETMDIAGRRRWSTQQTHHELQMLYHRTQAGSTGQFTASLLDQPASPKISVVPIQVAQQTTRPSLGPLHNVLVECDGHGWQPTSPLRTAMMVYLAGKLND
jgi:hypothetical protein